METGSNNGLAEYPSDHIDFDTDLVGNDAEYSINKLGNLVGSIDESCYHVSYSDSFDLLCWARSAL